MSLRLRLLGAFAYVLLLILIALEVPLGLSLARRIEAEVKNGASAQAFIVAAGAAGRMSNRTELRRLVKTLTAQGRMSRWIVSALPIFLLLIITAINPSYMEPLYSHQAGRLLLLVAGVLVVSGSLVIKRIVNIKV